MQYPASSVGRDIELTYQHSGESRMDHLAYIAGKFERAIKELVGPEPLQDRLAAANIWLHAIRLEDFRSTRLRGQYQNIRDRLAQPGHTYEDTLAVMTDEEAAEITSLIVDLYFEIEQERLSEAINSN